MTNPGTSTPPAASARALLLDAVRDAASSRYDILGELGPSPRAAMAYLARLRKDQSLGILLLERDPTAAIGEDRYALSETAELDDRVPTLGLTCDACHSPIATWAVRCAVCGGDVVGAPDDPETLSKLASGQYVVLGAVGRPGGGLLHFATAPAGLVALRLVAGDDVGSPTLAVTLIDASRAPVPTPPPAPRTPDVTAATRRSKPNITTSTTVATRVCPQCNVEYPADQRFCPTDGSPLRAKTAGGGLIGEIVADRYHVVRALGEGGMGQVYLAEQVKMRRMCALKVMRPALATDPDAVRRFGAEAENASRIAHPNVAAIYDFGETAEGLVYLAMEFVDGEPLAALLAREKTLDPGRVAAIGRQVAEGLSAAHELGIVHRDLKPDNVMIVRAKDGSDRVKVVDFGIAKAIADGRTAMTRTGFIIGTPAYMSPEQITGDKLDGRSDLYSLGCMLFEMLTGRSAFIGPTGEVVLHRRLTEPAPRPRTINSAVPKPLDLVVTRALSRAVGERFQTAADMSAALAECATTQGGSAGISARFIVGGGSATTVARAPVVKPRARRSPLLYAGAAAVVAAGVAVFEFYPRPPKPAPEPVVQAPVTQTPAVQAPAVTSPPVVQAPDSATTPAPTAATPTPAVVTPAPTPTKKPAAIKTPAATRTPPVVGSRPQPSQAPQPVVATPPVVKESVVTPAPSPAAVTPPVVSPPATTAPAPSTTPSSTALADAEAAMEARHAGEVLSGYVSALNAKDIDRMKHLYPTMPSALEKGLRSLTTTATDFTATLTGAPAATVHGSVGEGDFGYAMDYFLPASGRGHVAFRYHAIMAHDADGWRILSLTAVH